MKWTVVTLFPEMIQAFCQAGVLSQAIKKNLVSIDVKNPRDYSLDKHRSVDDRPFSGGDGMIMMAEPLDRLMSEIQAANQDPFKVIYLSPQGRPWLSSICEKWAESKDYQHTVLICGRYGGIDQRFLNKWVDEEVSIGDYVLSGGELGAMVLIDSMARWVPGVLGHENSCRDDSLSRLNSTQGLLEAPAFTRPSEWENESVPAVFLSGHHLKINEARQYLGFLVTLQKRPDLILKDHWTGLQKSWKFLQSLKPFEVQSLGLDLNLLEAHLRIKEKELQ